MPKNKKQKTKSNVLLIFLIISIGLFLRLYRLDSFPIGFTSDESAQGYSAYSILKTGRDEWGVSFPINPRSFGDYKAPIQTYLIIPSIAMFGLNEFAVRLPNAILSSLTILILFLLIRELFVRSKFQHSETIGLLAAVMLAVNPWHISLSRGAFEANLTTFFLPLGVWLFLRGVNTRFMSFSRHACRQAGKRESILLTLSSIAMGINLFTYHSAKVVTPLVFGICYLLFGREGPRKPKVFGGLVFLFFIITAIFSFAQGGNTRSADISIFSNSASASAEERYRLALGGLNGVVPRLYHNKLAEPIKEFSQNYLSYLSPYFLFGRGAGEGTYGMTPGFGLFYQIEAVFLLFGLLGIVSLIRKKQNIKPLLLIVLWILIGFIPTALSRGVGYHANRAVIVLPAFQILIAYGAVKLFGLLKGKRRRLLLLVVAVYLFSASRFLIHYFYYDPVVNAKPMIYGWHEASEYIKQINTTSCPVIVSSELSEPQAYLAFYNKVNPVIYQKDSLDWLRYQSDGFKFVDQLGNYSLANYQFRSFGMPEDLKGDCHILVGRKEDFQLYNETISNLFNNGLIIDKIISYPDGTPAMRILKIK